MKYKNKKTEVNGILFDSKKEATRYIELNLLEKAGKIHNLRLQVKFVLIPSQYEEIYSEKKHAYIRGNLIERECSYVADFVYEENGKTVVEDTKGFKTPDYKIKRKMMLFLKGIRIREV